MTKIPFILFFFIICLPSPLKTISSSNLNLQSSPTTMNLDIDDISALRVLGRGAMGTVFLATTTSSSNSPKFAIKVVEKNSPGSKKDSDRRARWEMSVLSRLDHPLLPTLLRHVETPEFIAWAVPFCPGGDLNALRYSQTDRVFSPSAIRFYVSEIVTAISHLHGLGIVYRDLKPENVLIQESGHVTLTDFDLSTHLSPTSPTNKINPGDGEDETPPIGPWLGRSLTRMFSSLTTHSPADDRKIQLKKAKSARVLPVSRRRSSGGGWGGEKSNSFVGTEEYVAPEVIHGDGHDFAVDWWALGILTYEMAYGATPFRGRNRKETFYNVLMRQPEFVGKQSPELTDLISRLLTKDPNRRLGSNGGAEEVKDHPFFHGVQWDLLGEMARPPYISSDVSDSTEIVDGVKFNIRDYFSKQHKRKRLLKEMVFSSPSDSPSPSPSPSSVLFAEF